MTQANTRKPGICPSCGRDYRTFHQWDDLDTCPRCGADVTAAPTRKAADDDEPAPIAKIVWREMFDVCRAVGLDIDGYIKVCRAAEAMVRVVCKEACPMDTHEETHE